MAGSDGYRWRTGDGRFDTAEACTAPNVRAVTVRAPELHPEARMLVEEAAERGLPPTHALSVRTARETFVDHLTAFDGPDVERVRDLGIPGPNGELRIRLYEPIATGSSVAQGGASDADPRPALVFFHGGGWVRGSVETHDELCRWLANEVDCTVVSVDYRRAPEHPFPAALRDCEAAVRWVVEHAGSIGVDPDRIAVGGDSAGGNLAAAVSLLARDADGPRLRHQVLVYPVTDHAFETRSYEENAEGYLLTRETMRWYWAQYLRTELDGANPYVSPLRARTLADLPSATVVTCGFDPLRDEGVAYAERLADHGVDVAHHHYDDTVHVFVSIPGLERTRQARTAIAENLLEAFER